MAKFNSIITVTIASGTISSEIDVHGKSLYAIQTPASIASSTLSFQGASASGGTFAPVWDDAGAAVSITCASSQIVALPNKHMNAQDALTVLRAAEKFITDDILEKAKQQTPAVENVG